MFLFTSIDRPDPVHAALHQASQATGVGFDYLLATAQRESSLDPKARAATSSATGLFQFIESTWLETLQRAGARHGFGDLADGIMRTEGGRYRVADPALKNEILALRTDPEAAALMAGELTRHNAESLGNALGRSPTAGELYMAHFLGAAGAGELVRQAEGGSARTAAEMFPSAARANRPIFFDGDGRARTAAEVYQVLAARHEAAPPAPADHEPQHAYAPGRQDVDHVFHGIFSDVRRAEGMGPLARAVSGFWSGLFTTPEMPETPAPHTSAPDAAVSVPMPAPKPQATSEPAPPKRWIDRPYSLRHADDPSLPV